MLRGARKLFAVAIVACTALLPASEAGATVTIGSPMTSSAPTYVPGGCPCVFSPTVIPGSRTESPVNGTVTQWSANFGGGVGTDSARLRILDPLAGTAALFLSSSEARPFVPGSATSHSASLPISIGDRIGVEDLAADTNGIGYTNHLGAAFQRWNPAPPDGASLPATDSLPFELQLNAVIEPSNKAAVSSLKPNKRKGTATLTVNVPNPGLLAISGGPVKPQTLPTTTAGAVEILLRPSRKAKKRLRTRGKAKGGLNVAFTPELGATLDQPVRVALAKKK